MNPPLSENRETVVAATDWVGRPNVFYTAERFSHRINDLIEQDFEWDADGLYYFLNWGLCVFERTPVAGIKFLPANADLVRLPSGKLAARPRPEPPWVELFNTPTHPDDVLHLIETTVRKWEASVRGEIVLPLSGGYDSRLIAAMVKDPKRLRAFSYGISPRQEKSRETVVAREVARRLGIEWRQIFLGDYHRYLDDWYDLFGTATHAHGMYHIEFFRQIAQFVRGPMASGLVGDAWAGKLLAPIRSVEQVGRLSLSHGVHADCRALKLKPTRTPEREFYEKHRYQLQDPRYCVLALIRLKMPLLWYLEAVPTALGFEPFSPLCTQETATAMLALPDEWRKNRVWQTEFFRKRGLLPESEGLRYDRRNDLTRTAWHRIVPPPLSEEALSEIIRPEYVRTINRSVARPPGFWRYRFFEDAYRAAARYGRYVPNPFNVRYYAYLTLYPLHRLAMLRRSARFLPSRNTSFIFA